MNADDFQKTRVSVVAALNNPEATVGASVQYVAPGHVFGNLSSDDPALSNVSIDDLGRLWKERHRHGISELICVLDLRSLGKK